MNSPEEQMSKEDFLKWIDEQVSLHEKAKTYDLATDVLRLLKNEPFFATVSRFITKRKTMSIPTAAISINPETYRPVMYYNPVFMVALNEVQRRAVIKHEYYHLILNHLTHMRLDQTDKSKHKLFNISMDLAINSFLVGELPEFGCFPGQGIFKDLEAKKATEWYIQAILANEEIRDELNMDENGAQKPCPQCNNSGYIEKDDGSGGEGEGENPGGNGSDGHSHGDSDQSCDCSGGDGEGDGDCSHKPSSGGGGSQKKPCPCCNKHGIDSHIWGDLTEEEKNIVEKKMRRLLGDAVYETRRLGNDENNKGWGSCSIETRNELEKWLKSRLNWKGVLKRFVQASIKSEPYSTIKKINKRYPWQHPGRAKRRTANIAVAIDQSGSVGNKLLENFFGELNALSKLASFTVIPFDHEVFDDKVFRWAKGRNYPPERVLCGGTDFSAPTIWANENGPFDGLIILTDMEAPKPVPSRMQRMWITSESCAERAYYKPEREIVLVIPDE